MISTHILDTHLGKPAVDIAIKLFSEDGTLLGVGWSNVDGRVTDFGLNEIKVGAYSLEFSTSIYFTGLGLDTFFPKVVIPFYVKDVSQHFHIPLLISPFAYSTYRGS